MKPALCLILLWAVVLGCRTNRDDGAQAMNVGALGLNKPAPGFYREQPKPVRLSDFEAGRTQLKSFVPDKPIEAAAPRLTTSDLCTTYMLHLMDLSIQYDLPPQLWWDVMASLADRPWPSAESVDRLMAAVDAEKAHRRESERADMILMELEDIESDLALDAVSAPKTDWWQVAQRQAQDEEERRRLENHLSGIEQTLRDIEWRQQRAETDWWMWEHYGQ
jgi:hypothetical protein